MRNVALAALPLLASSASALAVGSGNHRGHSHFHQKRQEADVDIQMEVVTVCELNGSIIPQEECDAGIAAGRLIWADGELSIAAASYAPPTSSSAPPSSSSTSAAYTPPPSSSTTTPTPTPTPTPSSTSTSEESKPTKSSSSSSYGKGIDVPFPDDIPCSEFPSDYGAVPVSWMGLGGWIGIQTANIVTASSLDDIMTTVADMCFGEDCCTEGAYCSYACPAGYQKAQWPVAQGATGQSVGGLLCSDGKLTLTNPNFDTLCIKGSEKVTVQVKSELSEQAAICRTDYPGTEAMVIPIDVQPGNEHPLTCPEQDSYYQWQGKATSAQYYLNPLGVGVEEGCTWSNGDKPIGNWAPINLGVGYSAGAAWLSIFQNKPTTLEKLDFNVEIQGDNMSGTCKYIVGKGFCSGKTYDSCNNDGCTVSVSSGTATYILSDA
ncbi:Sun domain protein [Lasiodiplodia theobromae]|uniref:Secreted beta-glucosidase sun1 n=1 Tax=Lasiodiplodia theobromae TaxID=45133 RepID=A0A5N5DKH5_9PEZI|nr:Sun domain protein [Lasiodiplodia theobromae]KAB2578373.1 Secreted beta-glucosidase sun1 [Lasiodiplodia theobromae]KAF4544867.1 Sun domain protein [Lasiodiplodia theobromae]